MRSNLKKTTAPASGQQGTALARALDKSEEVQFKVTECAGELSSVNTKIKEEIIHPSPAERVRPSKESKRWKTRFKSVPLIYLP